MRKEVILAILLGLVMGLIITYGIYRARTSFESASNNPFAPSPTPATSLEQTSGHLVLITPEDESVTANPELTITGTTLPKSIVVIFVNDTYSITSADETGNFSEKVTLADGSNFISIHSLDENGQSTQVDRTVVVAEETGDQINTPESTPSATPTTKAATTSGTRR
jgi:hypothetical protein